MTRPVLAVLALSPILLGLVEPLEAQSVSATVSYARTGYARGDYARTLGDWQADAVVRYHFDGPLRAGIGAGVGRFDELYSDPSFSSFDLFLEPSLERSVGRRTLAWMGARYGWAHERVESTADELWAWGWEAGVVGGLDYLAWNELSVGVQAGATHLELERDADEAPVPGGVGRRGWRLSVGIALRAGGAP